MARSKKKPPAKKKTVSALPPLDSAQRFTVDEAIAYLRSSRQTVYKLINAGELRVIKEGNRTYVPGSEIARRSTLPA
jgi:excisionase family DNA binding protein